MKKIVLFASGSGSNVENIYNYFSKGNEVEIMAVYCNNTKAGVIERCQRLGINCRLFSKEDWLNDTIAKEIGNLFPDLIVLAGFLWKVPSSLINLFPDKIINIHPALLPKFGGQGMYGMHVHEAVVSNRESESGITIHFVNSNYDEGNILFQATCEVVNTDSALDVAHKIHQLEFKHFPIIIEKILNHEI